MLFNSFEFIFVFLPITFFIYFYLNKKKNTRLSKGFLVFSSLFFYGWWDISYLPIILSSMIFNYIIGNALSAKKVNDIFSKKNLLGFGIISNIALLVYFKYVDFIISNLNYVGFTENISNINLILPLAISFFTFQQISYLVDSYSSKTKEYDFLNYALFVTFFPQLIAGPIVHHKEMMPQFARIKNKIINYRNIALGLFIFSIGLFKKTVIADTFAKWADYGFDLSTSLNLFEAWVTSLSYTFQLYFDFSGYADMAIGLALLFNIKLPINFNSPYKATSIQDFWRRWHMTLSRFLKEYIYIPLGGNKKGEFRAYSNLMVTFIIGGIWHGAGWTFIFWGFLHGFALFINKLWSKLGLKIWTWLAWLITFNFINITWIFFRAIDLETAFIILNSMFSLNNIILPQFSFALLHYLNLYGVQFSNEVIGVLEGDQWHIVLFLITIVAISVKNINELRHAFKANIIYFAMASIAFVFSLLLRRDSTAFLYFNF